MVIALRQPQVSEAERGARLQLAASYRMFEMLGWSEMIYNHITLKVPCEEGERLIANLGDKRLMMLSNHGILVMGPTLPEAFIVHWALQRACEKMRIKV